MLVKSQNSPPLLGTVKAPPDKSISHRAVIISSLTHGTSYVHNLLDSEDIHATIEWGKTLGVQFVKHNQVLEVSSSFDINQINYHNNHYYKCYLGNSGTSARLLIGVMAGVGGTTLFFGDASLNKRPMLRVIRPLTMMNAQIRAAVGGYTSASILHKLQSINTLEQLHHSTFIPNLSLIRAPSSETKAHLPVIIQGQQLRGINYVLDIASAQVKSAILFAGLFTSDATTIVENLPSRDHTENMLRTAGIDLQITHEETTKKRITLLKGIKKLTPCDWKVPGDFSSAAFIIIASLIVPQSHVIIREVNLNPLRTGLLTVLESMGANIKVMQKSSSCGEPIGDIEVKYTAELRPVKVNKELVPLMIDEFPILSCLAALVKGKSEFLGIEELRYKESDRVLAIETNLQKLGIRTTSTPDSLIIMGDPTVINSPAIQVEANLDHRIAMSFIVLGLVMKNGLLVAGAETINTSFPQFIHSLHYLGAVITKDL